MPNIYRTSFLFMLMLCALSLFACKQEVPQGKKAEFIKQTSSLVEMPAKNLGRSRNSVQTKLGTPIEIKTERISNTHNFRQKDQIHTLVYKGLDVLIYDAALYKKEMLFCVRMTANQPGVLPELIGQDENSIKSTFGDPTRIKETTFEYDIGDERIQIEFNLNRVTAVQWNLYVD